MLGSLARLVRYGLPDDYWATYAGKVRALKLEDIAAAAKTIVDPKRAVWIVVGDRAKIEAERARHGHRRGGGDRRRRPAGRAGDVSGAVRTRLWTRTDGPGLEMVRLSEEPGAWRLAGDVLVEDGGRPCRLLYEVACDRAWRTTGAVVHAWIGTREVRVAIEAGGGQWTMDGARCAAVEGCIDVDLAFTPATNTLPIRRLALPVGGEASVRAAWLRFPQLDLVLLEQTYRRLDGGRYRFESDGGRFVGEIEVDDAGLVTRYHPIWKSVAADPAP